MIEVLLTVILLLLLANILLTLLKKSVVNIELLKQETTKTNLEVARIDPLIRSEFAANRDEIQRNSRAGREEQNAALKELAGQLIQRLNDMAESQKTQLETFSNFLNTFIKNNEDKFDKLICSNEEKQNEFKEQFAQLSNQSKETIEKSIKEIREETTKLAQGYSNHTQLMNELLIKNSKENREELSKGLKSFEDQFANNVKEFNNLQRLKFSDLVANQEQIKSGTEEKLEKIRETVENKLRTLQEDNNKKLEEMRSTVDEKLQTTLEKRLNDSFQLISERLEMVHKGLGEMQTLANSVGDIKKVMTNVKSRGILGEYQLANILEDLLTNEQYEKNVKTKPNSGAIVEFAIKMPNNNNLEKTLWLPIDSKFPKEDYESLVDAYDDGNHEKIEELKKSFKNSIIKNAKDIKEKYIDPPNTTEYGIMFLPFESLFAEVLRIPGLFDSIQKDYKVTITGPTTLSALLNSLQMGFRTLAIEKRSSEVWDLLGAVKTEFGKFGNVLNKTKKKLQEAANTIDQAEVRSRAIERQLRKVQELPSPENEQRIILEIEENGNDILDAVNDGMVKNPDLFSDADN